MIPRWSKWIEVETRDRRVLVYNMSRLDFEPLKKMSALEIGPMGGRTIAVTIRMVDLEEADSFTEIRYENINFDVELEDRMFTTFALQSGRSR